MSPKLSKPDTKTKSKEKPNDKPKESKKTDKSKNIKKSDKPKETKKGDKPKDTKKEDKPRQSKKSEKAPIKEAPTTKDKTEKKLGPQELETGQKVIQDYISGKYWGLYLEIFLLFSVTITYSIILFMTDNLSGVIFIIFALICCSITALNYYHSVKGDVDTVLKDLEIMLKGGFSG